MKRGSAYFLADYSKAADPLGCCLCSHHETVWFKLWAFDGRAVPSNIPKKMQVPQALWKQD